MFYPCKPLYPPPWLQMDARHLKPMQIFSLARMSSTFDPGPFHLGHLWLPNTIRKWMCHRVLWYLRCCFSLLLQRLFEREENKHHQTSISHPAAIHQNNCIAWASKRAWMRCHAEAGRVRKSPAAIPSWAMIQLSNIVRYRDIWHHASRFQRWIAQCNVPTICRN